MCASPVVLLLSFIFFCCGSLTVRFRVSVKYFASPPDEGTPLSTENASLFQVYRFVSPASEREKGNEREQREKDKKSCKC